MINNLFRSYLEYYGVPPPATPEEPEKPKKPRRKGRVPRVSVVLTPSQAALEPLRRQKFKAYEDYMDELIEAELFNACMTR